LRSLFSGHRLLFARLRVLLLAAVVGIVGCGGNLDEEVLTVDIQRVRVAGDLRDGLGMEVLVDITSHHPGVLTYRQLRGSLEIQGRPVEYEIVGVEPGDRIRGGDTRTVVVMVDVNLVDLLGSTAGALVGGVAIVEFMGTLDVTVRGARGRVPVKLHREVRLR
jgi:hypothetical protein